MQGLGIKHIEIPLPFRLNHVNCFLAEGDNGNIVIDTGLHNKDAIQIWEKELENKRVDTIILTHLHPDHCGYSGILQEKTNAEVWMSETDALALQEIWLPQKTTILEQEYVKAAMPEEISAGILGMMNKFPKATMPLPKINQYIKEGQQIKLGNDIYEVIATPGHSAGLICFYQKEKSILFSTDHILPKITPNIAYWFYGESNPLGSYQQSLEKIKQLDVEYVIPSHGQMFMNATKRINEIWHHHEGRLELVMETTRNGANIFEVCKAMFTRELSTYDYQFAIGEAIAHLEYLRHKGLLQRELIHGKWVYSPYVDKK